MRTIRILESSSDLVDGVLRRRDVIEIVEEITIRAHFPDPLEFRLTRREQDVFELIRLSNKEIAQKLNVSVRTVKFHVAALREKTGAQGRMDLYALSVRQKREIPNRAA